MATVPRTRWDPSSFRFAQLSLLMCSCEVRRDALPLRRDSVGSEGLFQVGLSSAIATYLRSFAPSHLRTFASSHLRNLRSTYLRFTFVFQILDEWIHFQAALLHITVDPPKASEPFILQLATSTSFRALRGEHLGIFSLLIFPAYPPIFTPRPVFSILISVPPLHLPVRRGVHCRHPLHPLHAYLCISTPPSSTGAPGWRAYIYAATIYWSTCTWPHPLPRLLEHRVTPAQWLARSSPLRSSNDYVYIVLWRFEEYISSITNAHWLWRHHCNYALRGVLLCLYLRRLQFQEHHDFSVTGYGDILPERFEESPSLMATFSLLDITGDGDIGPVRFVEYIFIPISASSPSSSWCAPWSTSLATTTSSLCAARSIFSTYPSLRRPPHYLCSTRSTSSLHFYAALIQGVHCRYPLPRPLSTSAPPASTGAPCTISFSRATCDQSISCS